MNPEVTLTLDDCVEEVLGLLTGLDLSYRPELERYRSITRALNRALRANALEQEWGWYSSTENVGTALQGESAVRLRDSLRPRVINDDAVRLVNDEGRVLVWAYFLPRDAIHKYQAYRGLWAAVTRSTVQFSRPFTEAEAGLEIEVPVMREPRMFRLPELPEDDYSPVPTVPDAVRNQPLDFAYPDLVVLRAAYYYAQTDPVMQPRVQTLEAQFKDMMYQVMERDERNTDSPYENDFYVPVTNGLGTSAGPNPLRPSASVFRGR